MPEPRPRPPRRHRASAASTESFDGHAVLRGLDFAPPPGAVVGLLGRNGSGKSTMLKLLVGLLKPDAGDATIDGHGGWSLPDAVKANLGYVDQEPAFYPWLPARFLFQYLGSFYERWDTRLLDRLAAEWDVPLDKPFGKLSPGNRQKVALMAALAPRPGLLLLDEPVSALDPAARRAFLKELIDWTTGDGRAGDGADRAALQPHHHRPGARRLARGGSRQRDDHAAGRNRRAEGAGEAAAGAGNGRALPPASPRGCRGCCWPRPRPTAARRSSTAPPPRPPPSCGHGSAKASWWRKKA